ncbi:MAG: hypothetical protein ACLPYS_01330 [Vulcanimicrobiaceae bacterium]
MEQPTVPERITSTIDTKPPVGVPAVLFAIVLIIGVIAAVAHAHPGL